MHADGEVSSDEVVTRKKGRQQPKLADTPSSSASPSANLPFNASMKRDWCQGRISAKQVQEYAFGAQQQGAVGVIDMAKAGSSGRHPQNIHRSLVSMFGKPDGAPAFCWHDIPTKKGRVLQPFMLPHEWFAALCREKPDLFNATIKGGDDSTCTAFWTCMAETPFLRRHPVLSRDMLSKTIPLGFYGDAGSFSHQDSLYVFTWNSMLGGGQTMSKKFLITCLKKSDIGPGTLDAIFKVIAWSFNALLTGIWPEVDWKGQPIEGGSYLAGGLRGCLTQVRGDWEFYTSIFAFPRWNQATNMCWLCQASSRGPLRFTNFADDAAWRATRRTHESYVAELQAAGKPLPVLFVEVIGLRLESVMIDVLHTCDQGVASHIIGNIFEECLAQGVFCAGGRAANLEALNKELLGWYTRCKITSRVKGKLTQERIKTSAGWPKLKAKAAGTRHAMPFALELAQQHLDRRRVVLCQLFCEFYGLLDSQGMFLDSGAKQRLPILGKQICGLYAQLAQLSFQDGKKGWKVTPKVHLMLHLCEWQAPSVGNPRFFWVYSDEDFVGSMIEVAQSCHSSTMAPTAMVKWLAMAFDL